MYKMTKEEFHIPFFNIYIFFSQMELQEPLDYEQLNTLPNIFPIKLETECILSFYLVKEKTLK